MTTDVGLNVLLSRALISLTRLYERTDRAAPTLPFYANLLRVVDGDGADHREIATRARISKRAAKTLLTEAARHDIPTERTRGARTLAAAEAAWKPAAKLRKPLEALVAQFDLEHPHYLMQYGTADRSAIGGRWPGHGQDWKPIERQGPLGDLPVSALLSAALMDFTIRYESGRTLALAWTIHSVLGFPDEGMAFEDARDRMHLSGDGRSTLERHGFVEIERGVAKLTAVGMFCRDAYEPNVARVEHEWREQHTDETVATLRRALEAVNATLEPGLADHPALRWHPFRESSGE